MNKKFQIIKNKISEKDKFAIVCHVNPDGDAIGSSLGIFHLLKQFSKNVHLVVPNSFPDFLKWLPGSADAIVATSETEKAAQIIKDADVIFLMDFNAPKRVDNLKEDIVSTHAFKIMFDHHPEPEKFADCLISKITASSTCELVYEFIKNAYGKSILNQDIAYCLYTGLLTDTGNFSYSVTSKTLMAASVVVGTGINPVYVNNHIYDNYSEKRVRLLGHCLSNNLVVLNDCMTAYIHLSKNELEQFDHQDGDTEGIVNYPLSIKGVCVSAIFIEKEDKIKVSLRSKGEFSVNNLSRKYFNGGGHKNAAGGFLEMPFKEALAFYESIIYKHKEEILNSYK